MFFLLFFVFFFLFFSHFLFSSIVAASPVAPNEGNLNESVKLQKFFWFKSMIFFPFKSQHKDHKIFQKNPRKKKHWNLTEPWLPFKSRRGEIRQMRAHLPHHNRWNSEALGLMDGDSLASILVIKHWIPFPMKIDHSGSAFIVGLQTCSRVDMRTVKTIFGKVK